MSKRKTSKTTTSRRRGNSNDVTLPILPTRDVVPLPGLIIPVYMAKGPVQGALDEALQNDGSLVLVLQSGLPEESPSAANLSRVAGIAKIVSDMELPNGDRKLRFHVQHRFAISEFLSFAPYVRATGHLVVDEEVGKLSSREEDLVRSVHEKLGVLAQYDPALEEHSYGAREIFSPGALADFAASLLPLQVIEAQRVLDEQKVLPRLEMVAGFLNAQLDAFAIKERVATSVQSELSKEQHQEIIRAQVRQLQTELGEGEDLDEELSDLTTQLSKARLPLPVKKEAERQLRRLQQLHPDTSEAALARTYLDWIVDLPWSKRTKDRLELKSAKTILDEDHFGLDKSKERILDFLGVRKLKKAMRGPVLLFVGPPGVGKTSLGRSIARALGRKFVRVSVGGLRDEAELRGHRRTYVGAMPGRIIQGIKTAGTKNPVFMIDELDKIGSDFRGDPASVLLEVLDPEQNTAFEDHYLNVPFDLSEVMFICTANITDTIPDALLDRMEVIEIAGYTAEEKLRISRQHLIPQEQAENGLKKYSIDFPDQALLALIDGYTRESGVRDLRRTISTVFRKIARGLAEGQKLIDEVTPERIANFLGPVKYLAEKKAHSDQVGVVTGLAWTSTGGETMTIEISVTKGKGTMSLTGQMGDVMQESAMAALTYVLSKAQSLGINPDFYGEANVHVHIPQGAIPKDGPSAGIAIATGLVSVLTGRAISREVAMTGEITLRGSVLPIGGLREKALAALRTNILTVVIPKENERELVEFPKYLTDKVKFVAVETIDDVLKVALVEQTAQQKQRRGIEPKEVRVTSRL